MAIRQDIGARYVPKFLGDHDITREYEPLSIVDDANGNSYTSKIPVPSGITLDNTTYWAQTGNFSGAVAQLQNRVTATENDISDLKDDVSGLKDDVSDLQDKNILQDSEIDANRQRIVSLEKLNTEDHMVLIGDSVAAGTQAAPSFADIMQSNFSNLHVFAQDGAGWIKPARYLTLLQNAAADTSFDNNLVKKIIVAAGFNDGSSGTTVLTESRAAISAFVTYAKTNFVNADIQLINLSWAKDRGRRRSVLTDTIPVWNIGREFGCAVSHIGADVLHKYNDAFIADGFHPSIIGNQKLAQGVSSLIMGGNTLGIDEQYGVATQLTLNNCYVQSGGTFTVWECFINGDLSLRLPSLELVYNDVQTREQDVAIGTADFALFDALENVVSPQVLPVMIKGGELGNNIECCGMYIFIQDGVMYHRIISSATTYQRIYFRSTLQQFNKYVN